MKETACRGLRARLLPSACRVFVALALTALPAGLVAAATGPGRAPSVPGEAARRVESFLPERVQVEGDPPDRVRIAVSVTRRDGRPIRGLTAHDFVLRESGRRQVIVDFGRERDRRDRPLSAVLLVDRSGSIGRQMGRWREAGAVLLAALRPIDRVRICTFTTEVTVLRDFTDDPGLLASAVDDLGLSVGGTRVFAAVDETLQDLGGRPGRKVIFLMTDGLDNDYPGAWSVTSDPRLYEIARRAIRSSVTVVTILPGPTGRPFLAAQDLAVQTGGWWLYPGDDLPGLVGTLGERLLESYHLAYDSIRPPDDPRRRRIEVTLAREDLGDAEIRTVAAVYGDMPLVDLLAGDLEDGEEAERARAASDLSFVEGERAVTVLVKALKDDSPRVRSAAASALGRRGDPAAARPLSRLLEDRDPDVRGAATEALGRLLATGLGEEDRTRILDALERAATSP